MCGISGYFFHKEILDQSSVSLEKASSKIEHRGPDDSGIFYDFEKVVGLAHQRLSIIDTSKNGHQPMISEDQKYVIVFKCAAFNIHFIVAIAFANYS